MEGCIRCEALCEKITISLEMISVFKWNLWWPVGEQYNTNAENKTAQENIFLCFVKVVYLFLCLTFSVCS